MTSMYSDGYTVEFLLQYFPRFFPDIIVQIKDYLPMEYVVLFLLDLPQVRNSLIAHYSNKTIKYYSHDSFTTSSDINTNELLLRRFLTHFIPKTLYIDDVDIMKLPPTVFQCQEIYYNCLHNHRNELSLEDLRYLCNQDGIKGLSFNLTGGQTTDVLDYQENIFNNSSLKVLKQDFESFSLCNYNLPSSLQTLSAVWSPNIATAAVPNLSNLTIFIPPLKTPFSITTLPSTLTYLELISPYRRNFPIFTTDQDQWPPQLQTLKVNIPRDEELEINVWPGDLKHVDFGLGTVTLTTIQTLPSTVESLSFGIIPQDEVVHFPSSLKDLNCGLHDRTVFLKLPPASPLFTNLNVLELMNTYLYYDDAPVNWHLFTGLTKLTFKRRDVSSFTICEKPPPNLEELNVIECYYSFQTPWKWPIFTNKDAFPKLSKLSFNLVSMIDLVPEVVFPPMLEYFRFTSCVENFCVTPEIYNLKHLKQLRIFDTNAVKFFSNVNNDERGTSSLQKLEISSYVFSFYCHSVDGGTYDLLYDQIEWRFGRHIKKRYYDSQEVYELEFDCDLSV